MPCDRLYKMPPEHHDVADTDFDAHSALLPVLDFNGVPIGAVRRECQRNKKDPKIINVRYYGHGKRYRTKGQCINVIVNAHTDWLVKQTKLLYPTKQTKYEQTEFSF